MLFSKEAGPFPVLLLEIDNCLALLLAALKLLDLNGLLVFLLKYFVKNQTTDLQFIFFYSNIHKYHIWKGGKWVKINLRSRLTYPPIVKLITRTFWDNDKFWNVVTANGGNAFTACVKKCKNIFIWKSTIVISIFTEINLPRPHVFQPLKFYAQQFLNISDIRKLIGHSFFKSFLMHM